MNPAAWRAFAHLPSGVLLTLWLVALLAFGGRFCPMPVYAASVPPPAAQDCHSGRSVSPDTPVTRLAPCHDGACLRAAGHDGLTEQLGPLAHSADDVPQPLAVADQLPSDWATGNRPQPVVSVSATGPPPIQRSRVLRL